MLDTEPSRTALTAAAARAAHLVVDHDPVIFADPVAEMLLGDRAEELIAYHRLHGDHVVLAGARTQVVCRSRFTESRLAAAVRRGTAQYVVLGAGLDSYAFRRDASAGGVPSVRIFEVDHPSTQQWKRRQLGPAGLPEPAGTTFVPVDLETDPLLDALVAGGFEPTEPAFVSWLGAVLYLSRDAVLETVRFVAGLAPGSELVFDCQVPDRLQDDLGRGFAAAVGAFAAEQGEPWRTALAPDEADDLLVAAGLRVRANVWQQDAVEPELWDRTDALRPARLQRMVHAHVPIR